MGLFSSPLAARAPQTTTRPASSSGQPNLLGHYIASLAANRDTRGIVAEIKRANDAAQLTGLSLVRFQQFLLGHIEERVMPKDRARIREQILSDFPIDDRARLQWGNYTQDLAQVQSERDRLRGQLTRAEKYREQERKEKREVEQELQAVRRESQAIIDRLDEDLSSALHRSAAADDKISAAMIALAQVPENGPLPMPRLRPMSLYSRPPSMGHRPPSFALAPPLSRESSQIGTTPSESAHATP